jgi:hypothetical protein
VRPLGPAKITVYADDKVILKSKESTTEKKFQRVATLCKDFELNVNLEKYVVIKNESEDKWHEKYKTQ